MVAMTGDTGTNGKTVETAVKNDVESLLAPTVVPKIKPLGNANGG